MNFKALRRAIYEIRVDIVLENEPKVNARDKYGRTPLYYTTMFGNLDNKKIEKICAVCMETCIIHELLLMNRFDIICRTWKTN